MDTLETQEEAAWFVWAHSAEGQSHGARTLLDTVRSAKAAGWVVVRLELHSLTEGGLLFRVPA